MKTKEEDLLKQSNKSHKVLREKIKKRRKNEKDIKKMKKEKKKKAERKKQKKDKKKKKERDHSDSEDQSKDKKLDKYIRKLREIMGEEADDLFEMFELMDQNGEVVIEELENVKVKTYLKKIFKYFELNYNETTKEYTKPGHITSSIKKTFQDLWYKFLDEEDSDSDKNKNAKDDESGSDDDDDESIQDEKPIDISNTKKLLLDEQKPKVQENEEWRGFLDDKFGGLLGDDKKSGYKNIGNLDKKAASKEAKPEDKARDEAIDDFMKQYNSQFRKKSLLEEHQEKKKGLKTEAKNERRAFDRNIDLGRTDSKKIFQMLSNKEISLGNRFANSEAKKYL